MRGWTAWCLGADRAWKIYTNDYCFVFELRDGLIHRVREYMDTARGNRMIFGEVPQ